MKSPARKDRGETLAQARLYEVQGIRDGRETPNPEGQHIWKERLSGVAAGRDRHKRQENFNHG